MGHTLVTYCWNRSSTYNGEIDVYGIDLATLSFLSLGTKFIPKWNQFNRRRTFVDFNDFTRKMNNMAFCVEEKPDVYV